MSTRIYIDVGDKVLGDILGWLNYYRAHPSEVVTRLVLGERGDWDLWNQLNAQFPAVPVTPQPPAGGPAWGDQIAGYGETIYLDFPFQSTSDGDSRPAYADTVGLNGNDLLVIRFTVPADYNRGSFRISGSEFHGGPITRQTSASTRIADFGPSATVVHDNPSPQFWFDVTGTKPDQVHVQRGQTYYVNINSRDSSGRSSDGPAELAMTMFVPS